MAKRKNRTKKESSSTVLREILAAFLFAVGLFSALSLIFYSSSSGLDVKGAMGTIGVFISGMLGKAFGICALVVPFVLFYTAVIVFMNKAGSGIYRKSLSALIFLISVMTFLALLFGQGSFLGYSPAGGLFGSAIAETLRGGVAGTVGSYLIVTILLLLSLIIITSLTLTEVLGALGKGFMFTADKVYALSKVLVIKGKAAVMDLTEAIKERRAKSTLEPAYSSANGSAALREEQVASEEVITLTEEVVEDVDSAEPNGSPTIHPQIVVEEQARNRELEFEPKKEVVHKDYKLPPYDLLDAKVETAIEVDRDAVIEKAKLIEDKLKDFGVSGKVTEIRPGPVITMFEYKPAPGIKINKIASLENDLAMGLSAYSIRIIAPDPGKGRDRHRSS